MKSFVSFLFTLFLLAHAGKAESFTKGFNQAWFKTAYAYQWLDGNFDPLYNEDILKLTKESGSSILRIWLYEGAGLNQFNVDLEKQTIEIKPEVLKNFRSFLLAAREHGVKISLTFFDGNAFRIVEKNDKLQNFWWNIIHDEYGVFANFYKKAIAPIYELIGNEFKDVVTQVDVVNEINAMERFHQFRNPKLDMPLFICRMSKGSPAPVTASLGWLGAENLLLDGYLKGAKNCLDFYDIHLYSDTGSIKRCREFKALARAGVRLQLGEFGQASEAFDDELQSKVTARFLTEAKRCGFESALAWRLDDTRAGHNTEARFSFKAHGELRPAYYIFKNFPQ